MQGRRSDLALPVSIAPTVSGFNPRHAVAALDGITGARVDWADSRGLNEHERQALKLSEERSQIAAGHR